LIQSAEGDSATEVLQSLLCSFIREYRAKSFTMMNPTVGPTCSLVSPVIMSLQEEGYAVRRLRRSWDDLLWPHATHGFFKLKERIPALLKQLSLTS
jgi:deoxyribodipyrimidine photo-lyase